MILAKCCHDLDVLVWNLGSPVKRLSSVGSLMHYRAESVGPEIPLRCTDGCPIEAECPFSAIGIYLDYERTFPDARERLIAAGMDPEAPNHWPFANITPDVSAAPGASAPSRPAPTGAASITATTTWSITRPC